MKTKITTALALFALIACNKNSEGNKSVISENVQNEIKEESSIYKGLQNTVAKITYTESPDGNTATVEANGKRFILDKKSDSLYERSGISAKLKGDSVYIIQDDNIIPLKKMF